MVIHLQQGKIKNLQRLQTRLFAKVVATKLFKLAGPMPCPTSFTITGKLYASNTFL